MSTRGAFLSSEIQQGVEQQLLGAGSCETDSQLSPVTSQLCAAASRANHNGPEETNGNEASLLLANQERGVADSNSSGGKTFYLRGLLPIIMIINATHSQPKQTKITKRVIALKTSHFFHKNHAQIQTSTTQHCRVIMTNIIMLLFVDYVLTCTVSRHQRTSR